MLAIVNVNNLNDQFYHERDKIMNTLFSIL